MTKLLRTLSVAMLMCGALTVAVEAPASAHRARLEVINTEPTDVEFTTFVGRTSTNFKSRKLALQYWNGKKWVAYAKFKTVKNGFYMKDVFATSPMTFRVYGAKTKYKGKKYKAIKTKSYRVTPVKHTVSALSIPGPSPRADEISTLQVTASPARQFYEVLLQENRGAGWVTVAKSPEDATGRAVFQRKNPHLGQMKMRAVVTYNFDTTQIIGPETSVNVRRAPVTPITSQWDVFESGYAHDLSSDGRWVSFVSMLRGDHPPPQTYLRDTTTGDTRLISHTAGGGPDPTQFSRTTAVSEDGKYVAFSRSRWVTVPEGRREVNQVVWCDVDNNVSKVVFETPTTSRSLVYGSTPDISDDGKAVAFTTQDTQGESLILHPAVWDADSETTTILAQEGRETRISGDGQFITFTSTNGPANIYRWDGSSPTAELVSAKPNGAAGGSYSSGATASEDGRWVVFASYGTNLTSTPLTSAMRFYLRDMSTGTTTLVTSTTSVSDQVEISGDGSTIAFVDRQDYSEPTSIVVMDRADPSERREVATQSANISGPGILLHLSRHSEFLTYRLYSPSGDPQLLLRDLSQ